MSARTRRGGFAQVTLYIAATCLLLTSPAVAQHIYWSDDTGIRRARVDGTSRGTVVADVSTYNLALDVSNGHIYWSIYGCNPWCNPTVPGKVQLASLDGSRMRTLIADQEFSVELFAIDPLAMKLYWAGPNVGDIIYASSLSSANLDGTNPVRYRPSIFDYPTAVAVDPVAQVLYVGSAFGEIQSAPANDPGSLTRLAFTAGAPLGLLVDFASGRLYWAERDRIMRSLLDGSNQEAVVADVSTWTIALDAIHGKIYWSTPFEAVSAIRRANLDGSNIEEVLVAQDAYGLAVDPRVDGDFNMDARVDAEDHAHFSQCLFGPGSLPLALCVFFDFDVSDGDVDLADFAIFQNAMTPPG